jgi:hyperosmotically inducible protein
MRFSPLAHRIAFGIATGVLGGSFFVPVCMAQAVDNSSQNKSQGATADNQSNAKADRMMTAQIRRAIIKDKTLSMDAHNVKILVQNGNVTLKGPVKSDEEKQKVLADAASVSSSDKIADQLTVKQ